MKGARGLLLGTAIVALCAGPVQSSLVGGTNNIQGSLANDEPYNRTTNFFSEAVFYRPSETNAEELTFKLAPLLIQELSTRQGAEQNLDQFGTLGVTNNRICVNSLQPAVYVATDAILVHGNLHPRLTYLWFYSGASGSATSQALPLQGVRMTLNSAGKPAIWEVLAANGRLEALYVSQSLETAAAAEYGKPLPQRRFALEPSVKEAPQAIVPRVIDDGPVPMGPIIYLRAGTREVSTILCRCMAAQVKKLSAERNYDLVPIDAASSLSLLNQARGNLTVNTSFWPGETKPDARIEKQLRLPKSF